ncbi:MAG: PKD domain-containing protein, partial [Desulfatirhabdiaceae bacterium]
MDKKSKVTRLVRFILCFFFIIITFCNVAESADGRVVTVDGISGLLTAINPLYVPSTATCYLYDAISPEWRTNLQNMIGPVQPFYWGGNLYTQTTAAVESLYNILKPISDSNKINNTPLVILSHSWGTVLTYIVLHEHNDIVVDKLITMGSPLESVVPGINTVTYPALVLYGIWSVDPLPNIKIWHNYWASCDPVSSIIPAAMNHQSDLSVLFDGICHGGYYEDTLEWNNILSDALNTQHPLLISYTSSTYSAPGDISFSATGSLTNDTNATYSWNFGDGSTASGQFVTHFYRNPNEYTVILTMTDGYGGTHVLSESVTVRPPQITVSYPDGFDSLNRHFSTPSNPYAKEYTWQYGDGSPSETGKNQDHTFLVSGNYNIILTLTLIDGSTVSVTEPIFVGPGTIFVQGHTIYYDETWHSGGTYVVQGTIVVANGATLTIEPGTQVKLNHGVNINVAGILTATGVMFTAQDQASPWSGILFDGSGATQSRLENCVLQYVNSWYYNGEAVIFIRNASPTIKGCTINNCGAYYGIRIQNGSPVIQDNTINGVTKGIYVDATSSPTATGNTITNNQYGIWIDGGGTYQSNTINGNSEFGIYVAYSTNNPEFIDNTYADNVKGEMTAGGTIQGAVNWAATGAMVYNISGLSIPQGASLTIASGRTVKLNHGVNINVAGTLTATGVMFTAQDQASPWSGILFDGSGATQSRLENCVLQYVNSWYYNGEAVIFIRNASPTIKGCTINNCGAYYGIRIQ